MEDAYCQKMRMRFVALILFCFPGIGNGTTLCLIRMILVGLALPGKSGLDKLGQWMARIIRGLTIPAIPFHLGFIME